MNSNKRTLIQNAFSCKEVDRVPVGFWWHFISGSDLITAYRKPEMIEEILEAHFSMIDAFKPDFIKIMSDGFFAHPSLVENNVKSIDDIINLKPMDKNHPWVVSQVEMVKKISCYVADDMMNFYNIFSPLQAVRLNMKYLGVNPDTFQDMMVKNPEALVKISEIIAKDYKMLAEELKKHTKIDGVYYSVQNIQHESADKRYHEQYVIPTEKKLLESLNDLWEHNILHICGYDYFKNDLSYYKDYRAKAYSWAVHSDKVSLKEGQKLFNACVIGGFDNNKGSLIDKGSDAEIEQFVIDLINDTGKKGVILGADCTVPSDISLDRLNFVREVGKRVINNS